MNRKENLKYIEEDINKLEKLFLTEKKRETLEEEVMNILGEIEEKIGEIIGNKKERTLLEKERVFQRYLSIYNIETNFTSINDELDKLISRVYNEVIKRKKKLGFDIFKAGSTNIVGEGESKIEFKIAEKEKLFLRVLYNKGYKSSNIDQSEEEINPERMRQIPYQIFHLKKEDNKNTVLLCDEIGQATFIYDGIVDPSVFQLIEKGEAIGDSKALKIIYRKSTYETNLELALDDKLSYEEKEEKIVNEDEENADEKMEVYQVEVIKYFKEIKETEENSYNYWIGLTKKQIEKIEYKSKKITSLSTLTGWKNENKVKSQTSIGFQEFISWIFGREKIEITGEKVIKYFKEIKETEEDSYNYWMGLKVNQIEKIEYKSKKITSLSTITGWENENNVKIQIQSGYQEFISWIFGREIFTGKEVIKYFKKIKKTEEDSYNYWMGLKANQIGEIKYKDKKIKSLSTITGWENENNVKIQIPSGFQEFISWIFGREIFTGEKVIKYFKEIKETEEDSYNYWMGLKANQIGEIKYKDKKIKSLSKITGWKNENKVNSQTPSGYQEFISWIFGREILEIFTGEKVIKYFKEIKETEEDSYNYWMKLKQKQVKNIKYKDKKIKSLLTITGWKNENKVNSQTPSGFQEFISWVFRKE